MLTRGPSKVIDFGCSHAGEVPATVDKSKFQIKIMHYAYESDRV